MIIPTSHGPSTIAFLPTPPILTAPMGVILWGRCDETTTMAISHAIADQGMALWVARHTPEKTAIVWSVDPDIVEEQVYFDSTLLDIHCPRCSAIGPVSNGANLWRCKKCGRQWKKSLLTSIAT